MIKEVGSLVLAAGLALNGCEGCDKEKKPRQKCEALQSSLRVKEGFFHDSEEVKEYCDEIHEKASKEYCLRLRDELHRAFMALCLTSKTRFPHKCTKSDGKLVCKAAEFKMEKDSK
jgi:hypothetical protein